MTPPEAPEDGTATEGNAPPAVSVCVTVLKHRSDFLRAAKARRQGTKGMMVQGRKRAPGEADGIRVGFTCSKKVGNAVAPLHATAPNAGCAKSRGWLFPTRGATAGITS